MLTPSLRGQKLAFNSQMLVHQRAQMLYFSLGGFGQNEKNRCMSRESTEQRGQFSPAAVYRYAIHQQDLDSAS